MIFARLSNSAIYPRLLPALQSGFDFLHRSDLSDLPDGRHEIDGSQVFALIARGMGRGRELSPLEFHRRYVDIQYVVSGNEVMGWKAIGQCVDVQTEYVDAQDIGFFSDSPDSWIVVPPKHFTIFFPEDAHAPLAGTGPHHKVVIKVALDGANDGDR